MRYSAEYGRQTIGIVDIWAQDVGAALMRTLLAAASLIALAAGSDAGCYNAHGNHQIVCARDGATEASCGGIWVASCADAGYSCCAGGEAKPDAGCYNAHGYVSSNF